MSAAVCDSAFTCLKTSPQAANPAMRAKWYFPSVYMHAYYAVQAYVPMRLGCADRLASDEEGDWTSRGLVLY